MFANKEEYSNALRTLIGDRDDDDTLNTIKEFMETYDTLSTRNETDWEQKYIENDKMWREKYKSAFFAAEQRDNKPSPTSITFDDIFKMEG